MTKRTKKVAPATDGVLVEKPSGEMSALPANERTRPVSESAGHQFPPRPAPAPAKRKK